MDVRASLNTEGNLSVVTGEGEKSFVDNDSFFAKAPPQAASTVGRTKARRFLAETDTGSFLDDMPGRSISPFDMPAGNGARPKVPTEAPGDRSSEKNGSDMLGQNVDWSVVNEWCRANKSDNEMSSQDDRSSMGILNLDEMDLSTNNLLLETPLDELRRRDTEKETSYGGSLLQKKNTSENSTLKNNTPSDLFSWKQDGSSTSSNNSHNSKQDQPFARSQITTVKKTEEKPKSINGSSTSSNNSHNSKQDQPFARSQITTVKKTEEKPKSINPVAAAIKQSLFAQMTIGEEGEDKDASIYEVELQAEELNEIDNDFGEINLSDDSECEDSKTPVGKSLPKLTVSDINLSDGSEGEDSKTPVGKSLPELTVSGDEIRIDSIFLRPGVNGGEQTASSLPFLSKVSLFEGGSGSEIDTEDELEQARKEQGSRHEAAGQASMQDSSRPGLEGNCSDDQRLPMTQRQSAEGDVVSSPVPGDGGGGGDGSSGTESDDGRRSRGTDSGRGSAGYASNVPSTRQSLTMEYEEQRIRPMGDDLLSDMRFSKYERSNNQDQDDSNRIHSRYLAPSSPVEDTNTESVMLDDFLGSQNHTEDDEFFPGNRLEASGFNADDLFQQPQTGSANSNSFGQFESSFGSFGRSPVANDGSHFQGNRSSEEPPWTQLVGSAGSSVSSKQNSLGSESRTSGDVGPADHRFMGMEQRTSRDLGLADHRFMGTEQRTSHDLGLADHRFMGSEQRTSRDLGPASHHVDHTDYARLGTDERGSLARSSGSGSDSRSISSSQPLINQSSSSVFSQSGLNPRKQGNMPELKDSGIFKKPFLPAPKSAAVFTKSVAKSKTHSSSSFQSTSNQSSVGQASGQSSTGSVRPDLNNFKNDLAFRLSLTNEAEEQRVGLKRVPSIGETNITDLTVNDEEFFDNADALAMLDEDEKQFEEEHVFRQDDAMEQVASSSDGWAYKSVMSMARPSWLDDMSNEEQFVVRISVGSYMRGRTEALGSLDGDENTVRPDFGMTITSPNKDNENPARLVENNDVFEQQRTSGVGEQNNAQDHGTAQPKTFSTQPGKLYQLKTRTNSDDVTDKTLTMDSLLQTPKSKPPQPDMCTPRLSDIGERSVTAGESIMDNSGWPSVAAGNATASDISHFLKESLDFNAFSTKFGASHQSKGHPNGTKNKQPETKPASPPKSSHLPMKKGSTLEQNTRSNLHTQSMITNHSDRIGNQNDRFGGQNDRTQQDTKSGLSKDEGARNSRVERSRNESPESTRNSTSPRPSGRDNLQEDLWSSPNTSNYSVRNSGLFDRMEDFQFAERFQNTNRPDRSNLSYQQLQSLKTSLREQFQLPDSKRRIDDRGKTPPPDGDEGRVNQSKTASGPIMNLNYHQNGSRMSDMRIEQHNQRSFAIRDTQDMDKHIDRTTDQRHMSMITSDNVSRLHNGDVSRLNASDNDHGYMPGHHIPDGTAYSQRSDYSHMDHKGMSREDVAGVDDVGLAESRGFDMLNRRNESQSLYKRTQESGGNESQFVPTDRQHTANDKINHDRQTTDFVNRLNSTSSRSGHENQTLRLESWTQTSLVFKESSDNHEDNVNPLVNNRDSLASIQSNRDIGFQTVDNESFNMTDNMKSQQNFSQNLQQNEPEKLHLLTKNTSLLKTKFAQDNLKRDYGIEVMDKIYSNKTIPDLGVDSTCHDVERRDTIDSVADWTQLKGYQTMDASQMSVGDISQLDNYKHRLPSAQSTPMPVSGQMGSSFAFRTERLNSQQFKTPGRMLLCPVESPGVLKFKNACCFGISQKETLPLKNPTDRWMECIIQFKNACCVGISQKKTLPLKNPTDRWMECIIQVTSLEIDGKSVSYEYFPFELRREKIIIDPYKTENIDILFLPKMAGAYVAQVQIYSRAFTKADDQRKDSIPVNVTFQAIAEVPWIKVHCEDENTDILDFGEMVWGSWEEKTIKLKNMGQATVPLRLAITSTKGWHCFSFEPEGRMSDVSVISGKHMPQSGHGKTIINISLSGCDDAFSSHTVKVWCRPPDKQCSRLLARQPPEQFSCNIDVDVDIPCCKFQKLASLRMKAVVGVRKLHIPKDLKCVELSAAPKSTQETKICLFNAGNLNLTVSLGFSEHKEVFSVTPSCLQIPPGVDAEFKLAFKPVDMETPCFMSYFLMMVLPDAMMFELPLRGNVTRPKNRNPMLMCDATVMDFGGVDIGKTVVKKFRLMNKDQESMTLTAESRVNDISLSLSPSPTVVGKKSLDFFLPTGDTLPIYVQFSPSNPGDMSGKIVMKVKDCNTRFPVKVKGYGGVSKLCCSEECTSSTSIQGHPCVKVKGYGGVSKLCCSEECTSSTSIQGHPCVNIGDTNNMTEVYIRNLGSQPANVKVTLYKDLKCLERLTSSQLVAQPSEFTIGAQQKKVLELVTSLSMADFTDQCDASGLGAVLRLWYKDDVQSAKPHTSELIIGIVRQKDQGSQFTRTPSKSTTRLPPRLHSNNSQPLKDTTAYRTMDNISTVSSGIQNDGVWNLKPQELVLYCSRKGGTEQMRTFSIFNNNNTDLSFEISWPGDMLSIIPGRGIVKPRESLCVQIFASTKASNLLDQLPWSGKVCVMADEIVKYLRVQIRPDSTGDENEPVRDESRLVPVSTNIPQPGSSSNKLGDLEVSTTHVGFMRTSVGKTAEETFWLKNIGPDMLRWMFSSFASPYLQKTADKTKEMFRVSYKVFDFSRQFGKISGHDTIQIKLQFMPRSSGTFSQYWDLQMTGNSGSSNTAHRQDFIRVHFTGQGYEEPEAPSKTASITKEILQSIPSDIKRVYVVNDKMVFSQTKPGACVVQKAEFKNSYNEDVKIEVVPPRPPFYVKHQHFSLSRKRYLRFPIEFQPSRPGKFSDTVKFQSSKGENLIVYLNGEC